jgi:pimeloyl-ACP methyl ester carboxylesterase
MPRQLPDQRIPDAILAVVEGAAHMPNMERPAEFNQALNQFLVNLQRSTR